MEELFNRYQHIMEFWMLAMKVFKEGNYPCKVLDKVNIIAEVKKAVERLLDDEILGELKKCLDNSDEEYLKVSTDMTEREAVHLFNEMLSLLDMFLLEVQVEKDAAIQHAHNLMYKFILLSRFVAISSKSSPSDLYSASRSVNGAGHVTQDSLAAELSEKTGLDTSEERSGPAEIPPASAFKFISMDKVIASAA